MKQQLKLNYASVDRDKIISQVEEHFRNSGFGKLIDSKIISFLVDVFGATAEFIIHYIERRAEESFFDTAKLRSSVILGARSLGYSIRRPIPAKAGIKIQLVGNSALPNMTYTNKIIQFPIGSKLIRNGIPYLLDATYTYKFKSSDNPINPNWSVTLTFATKESDGSLLLHDFLEEENYPAESRIIPTVIQGESREVVINFTDNPISGQIFQRYEINDPEFSDWYGVNDPNAYNPMTGAWVLSKGYTQVSSSYVDDPPYSENSLYRIDRRSLVNHETLYRDTYDKRYDEDGNLIEDNIPKVCVIRTALNGGVEVLFGDGYVSAMPKGDHVIRIKYLATKGSAANEIGSKDTKIKFVNPVYVYIPNLVDVSSLVNVTLSSNIIGGSDLESIDSIKNNAPVIYNSLDRLVSLGDYVSYLTSLTFPLNVKHAIAWGEQEEVYQNGYRANRRFANHVYFSVLGSLYGKTSDGNYFPKEIYRGLISQDVENSLNWDGFLESFDYDAYSEQSYFNVLVADSVVGMRDYERMLYEEFFARTNPPYTQDQVEMINRYPMGHPVSQLTAMLEARSQLTVKPRYITPIVQEFKLVGQIFVRDFADIESVKRSVENEIYSFLDANVNFNTPIFISHINSIAKNNPDVIRADLKFVPVDSNGMVINDWFTEPEFMPNIPYEYERLLVLQNASYPDTTDDTFTIIPDTNGNISVGGLYTYNDYNSLLGKKVRISQNGGISYFYAEIVEINPTQVPADWYCTAYLDEVGLSGMEMYRYYLMTGNVPSGFPTDNVPPMAYARVHKVWAKRSINGNIINFVKYIFSVPSVGTVVSVAPYGSRGVEYVKWDGSSWIPLLYNQYSPLRVRVNTNAQSLIGNTGLIVEAITNMDDVYDALGFTPNVYLVEAIQTAIGKEVRRLFDVIHHKYCSCVENVGESINQNDEIKKIIIDTCVPFGMREQIPAPYLVPRSSDCHESLKSINWETWGKSKYFDLYQEWVRCGQIFPLSKDEWSSGLYNTELDINDFERVTALGSVWRLNAPPKEEANERWVIEEVLHHRIGGITERWFYNTLMRNIIIELRLLAKRKSSEVNPEFFTVDREIMRLFLSEFGSDGSNFNLNNIKNRVAELLKSSAFIEDINAVDNVERFIKSKSFRGIMLKLHNGLVKAIRSGMLDKYGNIVNYSIRNEIVQIKCEIQFKYG